MLQKKDKIKCEKELFYKNKLDEILQNLNVKQKRLNEMAREKGVSNQLNAYPLKQCGVGLNKPQFWDGIITRHGWPLKSDSHLPKKICFICLFESPLKMMKNAFYFIIKALFVLKIFKFLS